MAGFDQPRGLQLEIACAPRVADVELGHDGRLSGQLVAHGQAPITNAGRPGNHQPRANAGFGGEEWFRVHFSVLSLCRFVVSTLHFRCTTTDDVQLSHSAKPRTCRIAMPSHPTRRFNRHLAHWRRWAWGRTARSPESVLHHRGCRTLPTWAKRAAGEELCPARLEDAAAVHAFAARVDYRGAPGRRF